MPVVSTNPDTHYPIPRPLLHSLFSFTNRPSTILPAHREKLVRARSQPREEGLLWQSFFFLSNRKFLPPDGISGAASRLVASLPPAPGLISYSNSVLESNRSWGRPREDLTSYYFIIFFLSSRLLMSARRAASFYHSLCSLPCLYLISSSSLLFWLSTSVSHFFLFISLSVLQAVSLSFSIQSVRPWSVRMSVQRNS